VAARLPSSAVEGVVKDTFCSLIVVSNESPTVFKLRISRVAARYIVIAGLLSFLTTISLGYHFPSTKLNDIDHVRLQKENHNLQIENRNVEVRAQRLEAEVEGLEELSRRITDLIETE
jgi:hypothetical protein